MNVYTINYIIEDFDRWQKVYAANSHWHEKFGIRDLHVLQSVDNPNQVMVIGEGDPEEIRKMMLTDELKSAMQEAGVAGPPMVFIGEDRK